MAGPRRRSIVISLLILLCVSSIYADSDSLEGFDEEVVSVPSRATIQDLKDLRAQHRPQETLVDEPKVDQEAPKTNGTKSSSFGPPPPHSLPMEFAGASLIILYVIAMLVGRSQNAKIASAVSKHLMGKDGVFHRNFALVEGNGETSLLRETACLYKLYASGRRHAAGLLAEIRLIPRQDAFSLLSAVLFPVEDTLQVDVFMNEESMPPIVLAVATPKAGRALQRDTKDIIDYTHRISVSNKDFPLWPVDKLWVLGEHSSIFQDIFSDSKLQQIFSLTGPYASPMKLFRFIHFTSEFSEGSHKQVLRFVFKLPSTDQMESLSRLLDLVPLLIDTIGTFKLTPELKKRATDARSKQADEDDVRKKRLEALQQKKLDKLQEEKAKIARMTPEARQKYEDKAREKQTEKAMKKMSKKL
jgi:hypothetical protein